MNHTESSTDWWKADACPLPLPPAAPRVMGRTMPRETLSCLRGPGSWQQDVPVSAHGGLIRTPLFLLLSKGSKPYLQRWVRLIC